MTNSLVGTPSQTVGPYFAYGLAARQYGYDFTQIADGRISRLATPGARIRVVGQVFDGAGAPVADALVEVWQADGDGRYPEAAAFADPQAFHGFGRCGTGGPDAGFAFETIKPGACDGAAPHLNLIVSMRGLLLHVFTRMYFPDEAQANAADPTLASVAVNRRATLVATSEGDGVYRFDIRMQGERETVFFDV